MAQSIDPYTTEHYENKDDKVIELMDKLIKHLPFADFNLSDIIRNSTLSEQDKKHARNLYSEIFNLLIQFGYAEQFQNSLHLILTEEGINAKKLGGHFIYQKEKNKPKLPAITTNNTIGNNYGITNQSGRDLSFDVKEVNLPIQQPTTDTKINNQKGYWIVKILSNNWIVAIGSSVIAAIIISYIFKLLKINS